MATPPRDAATQRTAPATLGDFTLLDIAAYVTVAAGYLVSVLSTSHLTLPGFALLTLGNLSWLWLYRRLTRCDPPQLSAAAASRMLTLIAALIAVTIAVESLPAYGLAGFDWLLPLVTTGVVASLYDVRRGVMLATLVFALTALVLYLVDHRANDFWPIFASLAPAFVFVVAFSLVARWQGEQRERAEALVAQLEAAQAELRANERQREELTITRERNRMARDVHDTLGHYLTILAVQLETATKLDERGDPRLHDELVEARRVAAECLAEVRRSVAALRPADLTAASFSQALARLAAEFEATAPEASVTLDLEGPAQDLAPELRMALYRCVQEALTNSRKHAHATKTLVRLRVDEHQAELLILDNGVGATSQHDGHEPGFGLLGMRERIELLGGALTCGPDPARGWRVEAHIPRAPSATAPTCVPTPAAV